MAGEYVKTEANGALAPGEDWNELVAANRSEDGLRAMGAILASSLGHKAGPHIMEAVTQGFLLSTDVQPPLTVDEEKIFKESALSVTKVFASMRSLAWQEEGGTS